MPLITKKGAGFILPAMLFIFGNNTEKNLTYNNLNLTTIINFMFLFIGIIAYLVITKKKFQLGLLFFSQVFLILFLVIAVVIYNLTYNYFNSTVVQYLLVLTLILVTYLLFNTAISNENTFPYLCEMTFYLIATIAVEMSLYYILNPTLVHQVDIDYLPIAISSSKNEVTVILSFLFPLIGYSLYKKQLTGYIGLFFIFYGLILNLTYISILSIFVLGIPTIFFSFHSHKKTYPYVYITCISLLLMIVVAILLVSESYTEILVDSFKKLNLIETFKIQSSNTIKHITKNPFIGVSFFGFLKEFGTLLPYKNLYLTTLSVGGSFATICLVSSIIVTFIIALSKKTKDKYFYLLFFVYFLLCGIYEDTYYQITVFIMFLMITSTFQESNPINKIVVMNEYYSLTQNN